MKWGGAVVTVLLVVVWIGSGWQQIAWISPRRLWIAFGDGRVAVGDPPVSRVGSLGRVFTIQLKTGYHGSDLHPFKLLWSFDPSTDPTRPAVFLPLWPVVAASVAATAIAWRLDTLVRRRAKMNLCPKCGYDRTGLATNDAKCPECGAAPAGV